MNEKLTVLKTFLPWLTFRHSKMGDSETSALLPKVDESDIFCPPKASSYLSDPGQDKDKRWPRRQMRLVHQSSHSYLDAFSCCIKYLTIVWNLAFSVTGLLTLAIGIWGISDKESLADEQITYLGSDPMFFFVLAGLTASTISLMGFIGALLENTNLLKVFTGGIITFIILEALGGIILFSLRQQLKVSLKDSLLMAVLRYQDDPDLKFIMDEIQMGLQCCGVESYLDWKTNLYFNCSSPGVQACGVPASCCLDPLENGTILNSQCGFGTLSLEEFVAQSIIFLGGCIPELSRWFNNHTGEIVFSVVLLMVIEGVSLFLVMRLLSGIAFARMQYYGGNEETVCFPITRNIGGTIHDPLGMIDSEPFHTWPYS